MKNLFLLCVAFLTGCSLFVSNPEVTVKDVTLVGLDSGGVGLEFYLAVQNPNRFDVKLLGYSYDLKVLAMSLAKGGARQELNFAAKATTEVRLPVRVSYDDLVEILKRQPDLDRVPYQLNAGFDLNTPMGSLAVPFDRSGSYSVPLQYRPSYYLKKLSDALGFQK